ncbi:hypothetical protein H4Q26_006116 [Puccinia striiformis f. sp. tritici PST-130]|nr:hypothetical protein H4Q26_006116 [Puccinia striiformis f. sp. tritici PST-130]
MFQFSNLTARHHFTNPSFIVMLTTLIQDPDCFELHKLGHARVFNKQDPNRIIADIHLTDLDYLIASYATGSYHFESDHHHSVMTTQA